MQKNQKIVRKNQKNKRLSAYSPSSFGNEDRSKVIDGLPSSVVLCPISNAIAALYNNSTKVVSESKLGSTSKIVFNTEVLATLRGLFPSTKTYRFQIHTTSAIVSSGVGLVQVANPANPAIATYSEWAALAALFDECKLISSTLGLTASGLTAAKPVPLWIGFDHITSTAVGVGFGNVQRLAESHAVHSVLMDAGSGRHRQHMKISPTRLFALTSTPISTTSDIGLNGQWDISGQDNTTFAVVVSYSDVENVVAFRNRA
jgi:hypothetical protein